MSDKVTNIIWLRSTSLTTKSSPSFNVYVYVIDSTSLYIWHYNSSSFIKHEVCDLFYSSQKHVCHSEIAGKCIAGCARLLKKSCGEDYRPRVFVILENGQNIHFNIYSNCLLDERFKIIIISSTMMSHVL